MTFDRETYRCVEDQQKQEAAINHAQLREALNGPTREKTVAEVILLREIKLNSDLEAIKQLRRSLSIDVLEGPLSRLQALFDLKGN